MIRRRGLASVLFAILRPGDAERARVKANALSLTIAFWTREIPLGKIDTAKLKVGRFWSSVRIRHSSGEVAVSGLSRADAKALATVIDAARVDWWRKALTARIETLRSIHQRVAQLAEPQEYLARSVFSDLVREAREFSDEFASLWPDALPTAPELRMLKTIRDFAKDPDAFRSRANKAFVEQELWRKALTARIETLRSIHQRVAQLAEPQEYLARSVVRDLEREAKKFSDEFAFLRPNALSTAPELRMLKTIRDFAKDPDTLRSRANKAFVEQELRRSRTFLDRVEVHPLTDEQRRAVVVNEDRNMVIAPAGSGKTSVIVAKAGWLVHSGFRYSSELLLLAFGRDARSELEKRIRGRLGDDLANGMAVRTFHSLGMSIIGEAEGRLPALAREAEDGRALLELLKGIVADLLASQDSSAFLLKWFQSQFAPYRSEQECQNWGEYYDYIRRYDIRSLKGEKVKSYEECEIANFLFLKGVSYEYEADYEYVTATAEKRQYRPDFYLPEARIYIEHFGVDAEGRTAPFVDRNQYLEGMAWKRQQHKKYGTVLIETFTHERMSGKLTDKLSRTLVAHGVSLSPIPRDKIFSVLERQGRVVPFMRLLATFLHHYKGANLSIREVARRAGGLGDRQRVEAFLSVFQPVFERYQKTLADRGEIDFHDMINRATEHVEEGRYRSPFGYILVDEFQDISPARARLLTALLDQSPATRLFVVGDDWQAIYRFSGSDIAVMREFSKRFGASERVVLEKTFRCSQPIATVATRFVLANPAQIPKKVRSVHQAVGPCVHVGLSGVQGLSLLGEAIGRIAADAAKIRGPSSVLLLGRYKHIRPAYLSTLAKQHPRLRISYMTVHGSKGLEADYVVVLGMRSGRYGFPAEISDDPLLGLVLAAAEKHPNAEERRLFYVAMTRARRQVFVLAEGGPPSPFVMELIDGNYDIGVFGRLPEKDVPCPRCVKGHLLRRQNVRNNGAFYGCSNWPYCDHRQPPCPVCGRGLPVKADCGFRCRDCGQPVEACPACGGWLQTRMGRYGRFLGCSTWPACNYTRDLAQRQRAPARPPSPFPRR